MQVVEAQRRPVEFPCFPKLAEGRELMGRRGATGLRHDDGCGAVIPFRPSTPCPDCKRRQSRRHPTGLSADSVVIAGSGMVVDADSGEVVAVQIVNDTLKDISARLSLLLRHLPWQAPINATGNESRASGIVITHHTFGFTPPVPIRRRFGCSKSALNASHPDVVDLLDEFSSYAMAEFERQLPDEAGRTIAAVEALVPEAWRMNGSAWTSGIINNTASLPYHKDSGNVVGSWSAMLGSRGDVTGGYLHLFDYDCYFAVPDGSLSLFDGQGLVHGVTPMRAESFDAYRYTTVCYAKRSMSKCSPDPADEPLRAQKAATEAQERQLAKLLNRNDATDAAS